MVDLIVDVHMTASILRKWPYVRTYVRTYVLTYVRTYPFTVSMLFCTVRSSALIFASSGTNRVDALSVVSKTLPKLPHLESTTYVRGFGFAASASRLRLRGFGFAASASQLRLRGFGFAASIATFGVQNAKISNGRLPPEDGSDRRETLGKRVSDDLQHFIFRRQKQFLDEFFSQKQKMA